DPHSQRIFRANKYTDFDIRPHHVRRARQGYFANLSYVDAKIGGILDVLERTRMSDNTIVLFVSDHGDMLGEKGLWFKMSPYEGSSRVPLLLAGPGLAARRVETPVSLIDINATLADLVGIDLSALERWTDGSSLLPLLDRKDPGRRVYLEYAAEGSEAPLVTIREGRWKYNHCELDPPQLFDLAADPDERNNLAPDAAHAATLEYFEQEMRRHWDMDRFDAEVRASQARRLVVYEALRNGHYYPWDYQPLQNASERYMRNHMDLNVLEEAQRFPRGE